MTSPWTRNGMVRVQVANVAPQISGQIVEVRTHDNEHVHKGDVLYVIEKVDFEVVLDNAKATILNREADLDVKKAQNARRAVLTTLSTSIKEHAGRCKCGADLYLGSACATNSGAYQDRASPSGGIARCRNDLQRLGCRRKGNAGGQARPGPLQSAGKPALGKSNGRTKGY